jgi:hypothetical protein
MVAATGVLVAAIYYVMNLREQRRNRRITFTQNVMQTFNTVENFKIQGELLNMEWKDYDDFEKKYGSDNNLDNYGKRMFFFYTFESMGKLLKEGLVDSETLYGVIGITVMTLWIKFLPTIAENRRRYTGRTGWQDFEYLYNELVKIKKQREPEYVMPDTLTKYIPEKQSP